MRTRKIEKFLDSNGKEHTNVVWFGSSGKLKTNTESQYFEINDDSSAVSGEIDVENLVVGQKYEITVNNIEIGKKIAVYFDYEFPEVKLFYNDGNNLPQTITGYLTQIPSKIYYVGNSPCKITIIFNDVSEIVYTNNFDDKRVGIKNSLVQKLSTLQNELWFDYLFGMPITNKAKSKLTIDSFIISTIDQEPNIKSIKKFDSKIENKHYFCDMIVETDFGDLEITV